MKNGNKIRNKILIVFLTFLLLVIFIGDISFRSNQLSYQRSKEISEDYLTSILTLSRLDAAFKSLEINTLMHIQAGTVVMEEAIANQIEQNREELEEYAGAMFFLTHDEEEARIFTEYTEDIKVLNDGISEVVRLSTLHKKEEAETYLTKLMDSYHEKMNQQLKQLMDLNQAASDEAIEELHNSYWSAVRKTAIVLVVVILYIIIVILWFSKTIFSPLRISTRVMNEIIEGIDKQDGDLTIRIPYESKDEIGQLTHGINMFIKTLQEILIKIKDGSDKIETAMDEVGQEVVDVENNTNQIAATMQELSASMEEVSATVAELVVQATTIEQGTKEMTEGTASALDKVNAMAREASEMSIMATDKKEQSNTVIEEITPALAEAIKDCKKVEKINLLSDTLLNIASKMNLLALSAFIEAAVGGCA